MTNIPYQKIESSQTANFDSDSMFYDYDGLKDITVTLPSAENKKEIFFKNSGKGTLTLIEENRKWLPIVLDSPFELVKLKPDGKEWKID